MKGGFYDALVLYSQAFRMSYPHVLSVSARRVRAGRWLGLLVDACLGLLLVVGPSIMASSFELAELYKQAFLVGCVSVALVAWSAKTAIEGRAEVIVGWAHTTLFAFTVGMLVAASLSIDRYASFFGQFGQRAWSFSSLAALSIFAWLIAQRSRTAGHVYNIIFLFLVGCLGLGAVSTWSLFAHPEWNPTGSVYALSVSMAAAFVVSGGLAFHGCRTPHCLFGLPSVTGSIARACVWLVFGLSGALLLAVNFWVGWVAILMGMLTLVVAGWMPKALRSTFRVRAAVPVLVIGVALALLILPAFWKFPFSPEVALSQRASWGVAQQVLAAHPLFGTGPGTWVYDHALYRAQAVNLSPFWATRFDRGISSFVTLLATTGIVGVTLFLLLLISILAVSLSHVRQAWVAHRSGLNREDTWYALLLPLGGFVTLLVTVFLYNFNVSHQILFWTLVGCLLGLASTKTFTIQAQRSWWSIVLPLKALVVGIGGISILVLGAQGVWSEARLAHIIEEYRIGRVSTNEVIQAVSRLRTIHPWHDVSARILSQAYLVSITSRIEGKPASEQARLVADDTAKMVELALDATRRNPSNPENWSNAGLVYASIVPFTQGADAFALRHYREAWLRDPQNPVHPTEMGKVFLVQAQQARDRMGATKEAAVVESTRREVERALQQALEVLRTALRLKPDFAPAQYHLAVVMERQGKLLESAQLLEQVVAQEPSVDRWFELAVMYARLQKRPEAIAAFERLLSLDPGHLNARWQLAVLYEESGRLEEALTQLRMVATGMPTNNAVQQRLKSLEARVGSVK